MIPRFAVPEGALSLNGLKTQLSRSRSHRIPTVPDIRTQGFLSPVFEYLGHGRPLPAITRGIFSVGRDLDPLRENGVRIFCLLTVSLPVLHGSRGPTPHRRRSGVLDTAPGYGKRCSTEVAARVSHSTTRMRKSYARASTSVKYSSDVSATGSS